MKYLGIDYGTKKIGLAISDEEGKIAFPHSVILNTQGTVNEIRGILEEEEINRIIVGYSLTKEGEENPLMKEIRGFIEKLSSLSSIPTELQDERFTSFEATNLQAGFKGEESRNPARIRAKKDNEPKDDKAAALILQRFLDKHHE
jgi:putative Holliday junction resolvase